MQFDSLSEFIQMNGHGVYVWAVYIIGIVILLGNVIRPKMMIKHFYREQIALNALQDTALKEKPLGENSEK